MQSYIFYVVYLLIVFDTPAHKTSSFWPPARSEKSDTSAFSALTAS